MFRICARQIVTLFWKKILHFMNRQIVLWNKKLICMESATMCVYSQVDSFRASEQLCVCMCVLAHLGRSSLHKSGIPLGAQPNNKDHCIKPTNCLFLFLCEIHRFTTLNHVPVTTLEVNFSFTPK
jgi:hypothetical protein